MPTLTRRPVADEVKLDHIRRTVQQAASEDWSLSELAQALRVTERMARIYVEREQHQVKRLIRPAGREDGT